MKFEAMDTAARQDDVPASTTAPNGGLMGAEIAVHTAGAGPARVPFKAFPWGRAVQPLMTLKAEVTEELRDTHQGSVPAT